MALECIVTRGKIAYSTVIVSRKGFRFHGKDVAMFSLQTFTDARAADDIRKHRDKREIAYRRHFYFCQNGFNSFQYIEFYLQ